MSFRSTSKPSAVTSSRCGRHQCQRHRCGGSCTIDLLCRPDLHNSLSRRCKIRVTLQTREPLFEGALPARARRRARARARGAARCRGPRRADALLGALAEPPSSPQARPWPYGSDSARGAPLKLPEFWAGAALALGRARRPLHRKAWRAPHVMSFAAYFMPAMEVQNLGLCRCWNVPGGVFTEEGQPV